jgi:hypothetical protein
MKIVAVPAPRRSVLRQLGAACALAWLSFAVWHATPGHAAFQTPKPVAAYGFNDDPGVTTADVSGNGNAGTLLGNATRTTNGKFGQALALDGVNSAVRIADHATWKSGGATTFTISLWIKVKDVTGDNKVAVGMGAWPASNLHIYKTGQAWAYGVRTSGMLCGGQTSELRYLTKADDAFHHIALVVDAAAGHCDFYSDGEVVSTDEYVSGAIDFRSGPEFNDLYLGGLKSGSYNLHADIDELRMYRAALTKAQIQAEMKTSVDGTPAPVAASPVVAEAKPANLPPPARPGSADPTLLPAATGQAPPAATPKVAGGKFYTDAVSGVKVWRATSESYPCAENFGLKYHDYGDTNQISHEWGDGYQTILLRTCGTYHLVDFKRGAGFRNWRPLAADAQPEADLGFVFSNNPATPQIAYSMRNGTLHRYNTATNQIENTGHFPKTNWDARGWLQNDAHDTWFVANTTAQKGCKAWHSKTNESREKTIPNYDECHLENRGRYVELSTGRGNDFVWDLQTDTVKPFNPPTGHIFHFASPSGFFTSVDVNTGGGRTLYYRLDPATGNGTLIYDTVKYGYDHSVFHHSGNWLRQDAPDEQQWFLISTYGKMEGAFLKRAIGFMRLDGSDIRFLAHSYNEVEEYWKTPRAMVAPNGKLVVFDSEFRGKGGGDVYVVEVPVR